MFEIEIRYTVKTVLFLLFLTVLFCAGLVYLAIFGRALTQNENHVGIARALPQVIAWGSAVVVDDKTYLVRGARSFIIEMERQGFMYVEQMGAVYFFKKGGEDYISTGRMYSSRFMVFSVPVPK